MSSVVGGGFPVLLAPLTKPVQPFSMAVPSATAESSKPSRRTLLTFRTNCSVLFREFVRPPLIDTPLKFIEKEVCPGRAHEYLFTLIAFLRLGQLGLDWGWPAEAEIAFCWVPNFPRRIEKRQRS